MAPVRDRGAAYAWAHGRPDARSEPARCDIFTERWDTLEEECDTGVSLWHRVERRCMAPPSNESLSRLLVLTQRALGDTQTELGARIGVTRRTISRWQHSGAYLDLEDAYKLVRALHPRDPQLAVRLAAAKGATLEDAGIVPPRPPPPPVALPQPSGTLPQASPAVPQPLPAAAALARATAAGPLQPSPAPSPPAALVPPAFAIEVVVCAAAEALDASPRVARPVLLAAVRTAKAMGLDLATMERALAPASKAPSRVPKGRKARRKR